MPFETVAEKDSMHISGGVPVSQILIFLSKYKGAKVSIKDGHLCVDYKRNETPAEKSERRAKKEMASERNKVNYLKSKDKPVLQNPTSGDSLG